jgi:hypothetical protein
MKIHLTAETQFFFGFTSFPGKKRKKMSKEGKGDEFERKREEQPVKIHLTAETQFFFGFTSFPEKKEKNVERRERRCEFERKREEQPNNP